MKILKLEWKIELIEKLIQLILNVKILINMFIMKFINLIIIKIIYYIMKIKMIQVKKELILLK